MRSLGFWNGSGTLAALSLLILAGPTTPIAQTGNAPAAVSEAREAVGPSLSEEVRALREELRTAKAQIQILKRTIDAVAAESAAQAGLALSGTGQASDELKVGEVHFNSGSAELTPGARSKTVQLAERIKSVEGGKIRIVGYTDTTGGGAYNKHLALMRADSIAGLLESLGVSRERLEVLGQGEEGIPVPTDDEVAEPLNRCAGIFVVAGATN